MNRRKANLESQPSAHPSRVYRHATRAHGPDLLSRQMGATYRHNTPAQYAKLAADTRGTKLAHDRFA
jgi:hypothetical protein